MKWITSAGALLLLGVFGGACSSSSSDDGSGSLCDAGELSSALSRASAGTTVRVGACRVAGSFVVPAGVHLAGAGATSVIVASAAGTAITVPAATAGTSISDLSIESDAPAAIVATGGTGLAIERVDIKVTRGIGIGVENVASLSMSDVTITGPVTAANAQSIAAEPLPKDTGTHGLVAVRVNPATLRNVTVTGFADFGALFVQTNVTWQGASASANLGTGIMVDGGTATLESLRLCGTLAGSHKLPPYAAVFKDTTVTSRALTVCDNAGVGLLQVNSTAQHVDLVGTGNGGPAVWVQKSASLAISGASELKNNRYAGLVVIESAKVDVKDAKIDTNAVGPKPIGSEGAAELGDGMQLVRSPNGIRFENVSFTNNARSGIQLDLGQVDEDFADLKWIGVTAEATGAQFGALCQGDLESWGPDDIWSTGIVRKGAALTNDATVLSRNPAIIAGAIGPPYVPAPSSVTVVMLTAR
jgi:hypothetical protein